MNEKIIKCPYNPSHQISESRLQYHLVKCKRNYPHKEKVCIFDVTKKNNKHKFDLDSEWNQVGGLIPPNEVNLPRPEENWDNEDSPSPLLELEASNKPILRNLQGATKSERKRFRISERWRMQAVFRNMQKSVSGSDEERQPQTHNESTFDEIENYDCSAKFRDEQKPIASDQWISCQRKGRKCRLVTVEDKKEVQFERYVEHDDRDRFDYEVPGQGAYVSAPENTPAYAESEADDGGGEWQSYQRKGRRGKHSQRVGNSRSPMSIHTPVWTENWDAELNTKSETHSGWDSSKGPTVQYNSEDSRNFKEWGLHSDRLQNHRGEDFSAADSYEQRYKAYDGREDILTEATRSNDAYRYETDSINGQSKGESGSAENDTRNGMRQQSKRKSRKTRRPSTYEIKSEPDLGFKFYDQDKRTERQCSTQDEQAFLQESTKQDSVDCSAVDSWQPGRKSRKSRNHTGARDSQKRQESHEPHSVMYQENEGYNKYSSVAAKVLPEANNEVSITYEQPDIDLYRPENAENNLCSYSCLENGSQDSVSENKEPEPEALYIANGAMMDGIWSQEKNEFEQYALDSIPENEEIQNVYVDSEQYIEETRGEDTPPYEDAQPGWDGADRSQPADDHKPREVRSYLDALLSEKPLKPALRPAAEWDLDEWDTPVEFPAEPPCAYAAAVVDATAHTDGEFNARASVSDAAEEESEMTSEDRFSPAHSFSNLNISEPCNEPDAWEFPAPSEPVRREECNEVCEEDDVVQQVTGEEEEGVQTKEHQEDTDEKEQCLHPTENTHEDNNTESEETNDKSEEVKTAHTETAKAVCEMRESWSDIAKRNIPKPSAMDKNKGNNSRNRPKDILLDRLTRKIPPLNSSAPRGVYRGDEYDSVSAGSWRPMPLFLRTQKSAADSGSDTYDGLFEEPLGDDAAEPDGCEEPVPVVTAYAFDAPAETRYFDPFDDNYKTRFERADKIRIPILGSAVRMPWLASRRSPAEDGRKAEGKDYERFTNLNKILGKAQRITAEDRNGKQSSDLLPPRPVRPEAAIVLEENAFLGHAETLADIPSTYARIVGKKVNAM